MDKYIETVIIGADAKIVTEYMQGFRCPKCNKSRSVPVQNGDDVFSIVDKIGDKHKEISPDCDNESRNMQIITLLEDNNES